MATMGFQPYDTAGVRTVHLPSYTTGNFAKGDAVYLNAGVVTKAASGTTVCSIFGVAAGNALTSGTVPVYVADPTTVWVGTVDGTSVEGTVGENYGLNITSGDMSIAQLLVTNTLVRIIDVHPADGYKALGRVLFCWKATAIQGDGAAD